MLMCVCPTISKLSRMLSSLFYCSYEFCHDCSSKSVCKFHWKFLKYFMRIDGYFKNDCHFSNIKFKWKCQKCWDWNFYASFDWVWNTFFIYSVNKFSKKKKEWLLRLKLTRITLSCSFKMKRICTIVGIKNQ